MSAIASAGSANQVPLGALFREPHVVIDGLLYGRLAEEGFEEIRPAHGCVFGHLSPEGSTVTEIAHLARLTKATVVVAVDDLERLGYVERRPDPDDRRAKIITLTERGRLAVSAANRIFAEIEKEFAEAIGREEMIGLRATLERLHASLIEGLHGR